MFCQNFEIIEKFRTTFLRHFSVGDYKKLVFSVILSRLFLFKLMPFITTINNFIVKNKINP